MEKNVRNMIYSYITVAVLSIISGIFLVKDTLVTYVAESEISFSVTSRYYISTILFILFISILSVKIGWETYETREHNRLSKKEILILVVIGILMGLVGILIDKYGYKATWEGLANPYIPIYQVTYIGILEEIWFRLGALNLLIWVLNKIPTKKKISSKTSNIIAIVVMVMLGLTMQWGALITTYQTWVAIILRAILYNIVPTVLFSIIYVKKGIKGAILTHVMLEISYIIFIIVG